jgi:hypothetical protein
MQWLKVLKTLETGTNLSQYLYIKEQLEIDIFEFIEIWYNRKTRYSILDYKIIEGSGNRKIFLKMWNN